MRALKLDVDLTGSNMGPGYRRVELDLVLPDDWDDDRVRCEAARYYAVPITQVGQARARMQLVVSPTADGDRVRAK